MVTELIAVGHGTSHSQVDGRQLACCGRLHHPESMALRDQSAANLDLDYQALSVYTPSYPLEKGVADSEPFMPIRTTAWLALFLIFATDTFLSAAPLPEPEPTYHGKTLKEWIAASQDPNSKVRCRAVTALGLGPFNKSAVPALIVALKDKDEQVQLRAVMALGEIGPEADGAARSLICLLQNDDSEIRSASIHTLGRIGPAGVPFLIDVLADNSFENRDEALRAFSSIDPPAKNAVPVLIKLIKDEKPCNSYLLAIALARNGQNSIPDLVNLLEDSKEVNQSLALSALGNMGSEQTKLALPYIAKALKDPNKWVREKTVDLLKEMGPSAADSVPDLLDAFKEGRIDGSIDLTLERFGKKAIPALKAGCESHDSRVRALAIKVLGSLDPTAFPILIKALKDEDAQIRLAAAQGIGARTRFESSALPVLRDALKDSDSQVRLAVVEAFRCIHPGSESQILALASALIDSKLMIRKRAATELKWLASTAKPAVPALTLALRDKDQTVRRIAAEALGEIGPESKKAVKDLQNTLKDLDPLVRLAAAVALGRIGPLAKESSSSLAEALADPVETVRVEAALALWLITQNDEIAFPVLFEVLSEPIAKGESNEKRESREKAALSLGQMGKKAAGAVAVLIETTKYNDTRVRLAAAYALGKIGPSAKLAIPALIQMLRNGECMSLPKGERASAARALADLGPNAIPALVKSLQESDYNIGPPAQSAVPGLAEALIDPDKDVRSEVLKALSAIGLESKKAVPAIADALRDREAEVRMIAAELLGKLGPEARQAASALRVTIEDTDAHVCVQAAISFWQVTQTKEVSLPVLQSGLKNNKASVRVEAAVGLWEIAQDKNALHTLIDCLQEEEEYAVDYAASQALIKIGPGAKEIVPDLVRIIQDPTTRYYDVASEALKQIDPEAAKKAGVR
jgi:HEAT repeat protein